jgi:hypothetical protein
MQGFRMSEHATPSGPTLEAGFWSRQMLDRLPNGFCLFCGDEYADADMAVSLRAAGGRVVLEPESRIMAGPERAKLQPAFKAGLFGERLFWRSLAAEPILSALALHLFEIVRHAVMRAPLGTLPMLSGRLVALLQFGWYIPRFRELRRLMQGQAATLNQPVGLEPAGGGSRTLRFEEGHVRTGRPPRRRKQPLKRTA